MKFRRALVQVISIAEQRISGDIGRELLVAVDIDQLQRKRFRQLKQGPA